MISPAMNTNMYENPILQDNLDILRKFGYEIIEPASGYLACGDTGAGKMPEPEELLAKIVPEYVGGVIYSAVCEALASESGARRSAMNAANKNAEEMIGTLMLKYNRARQAVITQEITEIVSGAEAL
jgi:F0F1-type ATP synthase gamma subunit